MLATCTLLAGGCAHRPPAPSVSKTEPATQAPSFEPFEAKMIEDQPLAEYISARLFRITGNLAPYGTEGEAGEPVGLQKVHRDRESTFGWAVPLTPDGYFLTAAHIIERSPQPLHLMGRTAEGGILAAPLRVVWNSWENMESEDLAVLIPTDFAIVHVHASHSISLQWADPWELRSGTMLVAGGGSQFWPPTLTGGKLSQTRPGVIAREVSTTPGSVGSLVLVHNAHEGYGDSGAPVFLENGRFAGITIGGGNWEDPAHILGGPPSEADRANGKPSSKAMAIYPDPDALERIISEDRRKSAEKRR